jgi:peptidyl-prolyl cis-trans isomerase SurA
MKPLIIAALALVAATSATAQQPSSQVPLPGPDSALLAAGVKLNYIVAVVGTKAITWYDVLEVINQRRAKGLQVPPDSASQMALARSVASDLVDEEVLIQRAAVDSVTVPQEEVNARVDEQVRNLRRQFRSDAELEAALRTEGFGTMEEYRRVIAEQVRRVGLQQQVLAKLRSDGLVVPVAVSEADVQKAFDDNRAELGQRPASVTFRQIIMSPKPSDAARVRARAKAESLLVELRGGADFAQVAKRESHDQSNKDTGGDLGWNRRGVMVPEFDRWMFALPPGQLSPVVETSFGYHIIMVDRVQPAEVKARHILIRAAVDSADIARARVTADSIAAAWRAGASFDSLAAKYHDPAEFKSILDPFPRTELPQSYQTAFEGKAANAIVDPFTIDDPRTQVPKFVIAQLVSVDEGGELTLNDLRPRIRRQLGEERAVRRLLDRLREEMYISIRI